MCLEWFADRDKRKIKIHQHQKKTMRRTQRHLPANLIDLDANRLGVSGGVVHGQALDQLCLCIEQVAVFLELLGVPRIIKKKNKLR